MAGRLLNPLNSRVLTWPPMGHLTRLTPAFTPAASPPFGPPRRAQTFPMTRAAFESASQAVSENPSIQSVRSDMGDEDPLAGMGVHLGLVIGDEGFAGLGAQFHLQ